MVESGEFYTPPLHLYTTVSLRCSGGGMMRLESPDTRCGLRGLRGLIHGAVYGYLLLLVLFCPPSRSTVGPVPSGVLINHSGASKL